MIGGTRMKKWLLLVLCISCGGLLLFGYLLISNAQKISVDKEMKQLENTLQFLSYHKVDAASKQIFTFFDQFPQEKLQTSDAQMMFQLIKNETKNRFIYEPDHLQALEKEVLKVYLFVDALQGEKHALWVKQLENLQEKIGHFITQVDIGTDSEKNWKKFKASYDEIYPSMYISTPLALLQQINKTMENLDFYYESRHTNKSYKKEWLDLQMDFSYLLEKNQKDGLDFSFYLLLFFTGGTILSTLSYVALRKYFAKKKEMKLPMQSKDL